MLSAAAAVGEDYVGGPIDPPSPDSAIGGGAGRGRAPLKRSELKLSPKSRSFSPMC